MFFFDFEVDLSKYSITPYVIFIIHFFFQNNRELTKEPKKSNKMTKDKNKTRGQGILQKIKVKRKKP